MRTRTVNRQMACVQRSRRGQAEMLEWFPRIILMIIALIIVVVLVRYFTNRDPTSPEISRAAYLYRVYYGDVVMYQDPDVGRIYPGVIDANKFTSKRLDDLFQESGASGVSAISARLNFTPSGNCPVKFTTPIYNDEKTYLATGGRIFANLGTQGGQSGSVEDVWFPATMKSDDGECGGMLGISIVRSNS